MFMDEDDAILLSALGEKPPIDIADPDNLSMRSIKSVKSAAPSSGVLDSPLDPNTPSFHPPDPQKKKKLLYLEGLRGIAALVVTGKHYSRGLITSSGAELARRRCEVNETEGERVRAKRACVRRTHYI
jgi:hypothetical protein